MLTLLRITPDCGVLTHRFPTRITRGSPAPFAFATLSRIRFFITLTTCRFLGTYKKNPEKLKVVKFSQCDTTWRTDMGGIGAHIFPGKWVVSVPVRTKDQVEALLNRWLVRKNPYQLKLIYFRLNWTSCYWQIKTFNDFESKNTTSNIYTSDTHSHTLAHPHTLLAFPRSPSRPALTALSVINP